MKTKNIIQVLAFSLALFSMISCDKAEKTEIQTNENPLIGTWELKFSRYTKSGFGVTYPDINKESLFIISNDDTFIIKDSINDLFFEKEYNYVDSSEIALFNFNVNNKIFYTGSFGTGDSDTLFLTFQRSATTFAPLDVLNKYIKIQD
jgi:hypothetical protein